MLASAPLLLAACATGSYAGVSFAPGAAETALQALARRAQAGDKQAQLDLGIRYEEGRGVPMDLDRARSLYRRAGENSGGTLYVYSPPVGRHGQGRVLPISRGALHPGLADARARLARLRSGAVPTASQARSEGHDAGGEPARAAGEAAAVPPLGDMQQAWLNVVRTIAEPRSMTAVLDALRSGEVAGNPQAVHVARQLLACSDRTANAPFPIARAACANGQRSFFVLHYWDEALAPFEARSNRIPRPDCFTVPNAFSAAAPGLRPQYFYPDLLGGRPPGRGAALETDISLRAVYRSRSGAMIYIDARSQHECLSSFFVFAPLDQ